MVGLGLLRQLGKMGGSVAVSLHIHARPEGRAGSVDENPAGAARPVEVGVMGFPYRVADIMIGNAVAAEAAGVGAVWFPDHLMGWHRTDMWQAEGGDLAKVVADPHSYLDPFVASCLALVATRQVKVGIAVTESYRRHPAAIAQAAASLAELAPGRFVLGLGTGEGVNTKPLGIDRLRPVTRLAEAVEIILLLLTSEGPVSYSGEFFTLDRVPGMACEHPPEIVLGGHSGRLIALAGRTGSGWLPVLPTDASRYGRGLDALTDAAGAAGVERGVAGVYLYAVIHPDEAMVAKALASPLIKAQALAGNAAMFAQAGATHPLGESFAGLRDFVPEWTPPAVMRDALDAIDEDMARRIVVNGTPREVAARIDEFVAAGARRVVIDNLLPLGVPEEIESAAEATWATVRYSNLATRKALA